MKVGKMFQKVLNDNSAVQSIYNDCNSYDDILDRMGKMLVYYIITRDPTIKRYDEIEKLKIKNNIYDNKIKIIYNQKNGETLQDAIYRNSIDEGFLTHSFNGINLDSIKKNGLGSNSIYDQKLFSDIKKLEKVLGKSMYLSTQTKDDANIYCCTPGYFSFHYACSMSPERLFEGPLSFYGKKIIIGESKENFFKRAIYENLKKSVKESEFEEYKKIADSVIDKVCLMRPIIALLPIRNGKNSPNFALILNSKTIKYPIMTIIKNGMKNKNVFFNSHAWDSCNSPLEDIITSGVNIPAEDLQFIEVPDKFEIITRMAYNKGCKIGDIVDIDDIAYNSDLDKNKILELKPKEKNILKNRLIEKMYTKKLLKNEKILNAIKQLEIEEEKKYNKKLLKFGKRMTSFKKLKSSKQNENATENTTENTTENKIKNTTENKYSDDNNCNTSESNLHK